MLQTELMIDRWQAAWKGDGLGMWVARSASSATKGQLVGIGGCAIRHSAVWNLGFRLSPSFLAARLRPGDQTKLARVAKVNHRLYRAYLLNKSNCGRSSRSRATKARRCSTTG